MQGYWQQLAHWIDRLNARIGRAMWYLTLAMILAGAYNAITRYLSRNAQIDPATASGIGKVLHTIGTTALRMNSNMFIELQWYLFSMVFLFGAAYTLGANAHVRVDIFFNRWSRRTRARIDLWGAWLFLLPFCGLMIATSWPVVVDAVIRLEGSPDPGGLPRYPLLAVIPIAFALLLLQGVAHIICNLQELKQPPEQQE